MLGAILTRDSPENANPSAGRDPFTAGERNRERSVARGVTAGNPNPSPLCASPRVSEAARRVLTAEARVHFNEEANSQIQNLHMMRTGCIFMFWSFRPASYSTVTSATTK